MMLGNLSLEQIQKRAGFEFPAELIEYMAPKHQDRAKNIEKGHWHCFDIPFVLVCGDMEMAETIHNHLKPYSKQFKEPLQLAL